MINFKNKSALCGIKRVLFTKETFEKFVHQPEVIEELQSLEEDFNHPSWQLTLIVEELKAESKVRNIWSRQLHSLIAHILKAEIVVGTSRALLDIEKIVLPESGYFVEREYADDEQCGEFQLAVTQSALRPVGVRFAPSAPNLGEINADRNVC